ncbi:phytanoyl-CoA dioxygenase family protein [Chloroflexi bacterium TSY]|nr:phytanoyl-CoA dioxygenase family protein [Chloroflexi bacterium TSY]
MSQAELSTGQLAPETLEQAVRQVKSNGFVVLENVLSVDLVDELNAGFLKVLDELLKTDAEKTEVNTSAFRTNRIRMDLPFRDPFTHPQIITNRFAMPIVEQIVGEDCRMFYFAVDAPMPGSNYQRVHGDYKPFYPEADIILPTTAVVVNYPLIDVTEQNGPMEAWPNTHLTPEKFYMGSQVQEAAKRSDPVKMLTPKGSVIIHDMRMWHRGTPNVSDEIRPNMALIYGREWWDGAFFRKPDFRISKQIHVGLSDRAKELFRYETLVD